MVYISALLVLINLAFVQMFFHPDGGCDFSERLTSKQMTSFKNPHWPATYAPGTSCRWTFDCPIWYACRLQCFDVGLPQTEDCYMDKLLVSESGNPQLEGAQVYCGRTEINFRSVGSRMTLALVASRLSPGGRFRCTIKSEPWTQPWFMPPCSPNPIIPKEGSSEERDVPHKQKLIAPPHTYPKRVQGDVPHTGLVQTRTRNNDYEPEKIPHVKNIKPEPSYSKHGKGSSRAAPSVSKHSQSKTQHADSFDPHIVVESPYSDKVEYGVQYDRNLQSKISHEKHAKSPHGKSSNHHEMYDSAESGGIHAEVESLEAKDQHVRHAKAAAPVYDTFNSHKKGDSADRESVENREPHIEDVPVKSSNSRHTKTGSSYSKHDHPQHHTHTDTQSPHFKKIRPKPKPVRNVKADSMDASYNPHRKSESSSSEDRYERDAKSLRNREVKDSNRGGHSHDRYPQPETRRRRHKVTQSITHVKRSQSRRLIQVQPPARHIKHEVKHVPAPPQAKHIPAAIPRITHQRPGLQNSRRVRTHIQRSNKHTAMAPHRHDKSGSVERHEKFF